MYLFCISLLLYNFNAYAASEGCDTTRSFLLYCTKCCSCSLCSSHPLSRLYPAVWKQYTHSRLSVLFLQGKPGQHTVNTNSRIHSIYTQKHKLTMNTGKSKSKSYQTNTDRWFHSIKTCLSIRFKECLSFKIQYGQHLWCAVNYHRKLSGFVPQFVKINNNHICSNTLKHTFTGQDIPDGLKCKCAASIFVKMLA